MAKYIFDYSRLNGRVQEYIKAGKTTRKRLSYALGISYDTFCHKLNSPSKSGTFSPAQIVILSKCLDISNEQIPSYFLDYKVEESEQTA